MSKNMTLGDLLEALEELVDDYPGIEGFPVLVVDEMDGDTDGLLTSVVTDGENIILGFEEGM